jgi:L-ascorbate metabolism protein UlaG (beta-lactamase superfamily)
MRRFLPWIALAILTVLSIASISIVWMWNDRPDPYRLGIPAADPSDGSTRPGSSGGHVTLTWLGVTTLLFDDAETQLLVDGFFSRPTLLDLALDREITPDVEAVDAALAAAGITQLDAVMTVHSHFDHALDTALVAQRTGAVVIGSQSTANLARGAGLPESRIRTASEEGGSWTFGRFRVEFVRSRHMPVNDAGDPPFPGRIEAPLAPPAPVSAWREGGSYTIVVHHPAGSTLVQGSAGFVPGALSGHRADVVLLGVGGLGRLGRAYTEDYWREVVSVTGARWVLPVHFDDFTLPYGEVGSFPRAIEDLEWSLGWLMELAGGEAAPVRLELPTFRQPIRLY